MAMYLRDGSGQAAIVSNRPLQLVAAISLVITLAFGIAPRYLIDQVTVSGRGVAKRAALLHGR
jgi:hypothetical protein